MTIADDYVQKMIDADPDVANVTQLANAHAYNGAFWRGFRACCQGDPFASGTYGASWQTGWKAAQAQGLFDVWSAGTELAPLRNRLPGWDQLWAEDGRPLHGEAAG